MFEFLRRFKKENPVKVERERIASLPKPEIIKEEISIPEPISQVESAKEEPIPLVKEIERKEMKVKNVPAYETYLPHALQMEIVKRIAWYWKDREIMDYFEHDLGKNIDRASVNRYRHEEKWQPLIERERGNYNTLIFQVPLANKRNRLDQLQKQYDGLTEFSGKEVRKEAREIIRDVRDEIETKIGGDVNFNFTQVTNNQFNRLSYEELMKEKAETLKKLENISRLKMNNQGVRDGISKEIETTVEEA